MTEVQFDCCNGIVPIHSTIIAFIAKGCDFNTHPFQCEALVNHVCIFIFKDIDIGKQLCYCASVGSLIQDNRLNAA